MKFSALLGAVVSASCFTMVSAGPTRNSRAEEHYCRGTTWTNPAGAFYTITNQPTGNYILTSEIACDGQLTYKTAIYAGGHGGSGTDPELPNGGDALFSQGSIRVSHKNGIVATVNAGSNTIAAFNIDPGEPALLGMIGRPVSSGGEFPISVAFNSNGTVVCALNGGAVNGVSCFTVDKRRGLSPIPGGARHLGVNETTPPFGGPSSLSQVIFTEDDKYLIASAKGDTTENTHGFLAVWSVASDGSLSKQFRAVTTPNIGQRPFGISQIPGTSAFFVADSDLGYEIWKFANEDLTTAQTNISQFPVPNQIANCWSIRSPTTGSYFTIDPVDTMTEISVDNQLNTHIIKQYSTPSGSFLLDVDIATVNGTDYLYQLAAGVSSIYVYSIPSPGNLQKIQTLNLATPAQRQGVVVNLRGSQGAAVYLAASKF
ncbi:hypothetical protein AX17_005642 [Amanita inopinata Kibby_2008]|nr:hypothetical protein AX17_005642 [Amanita inopinata Kibby_2008]